MLIENDAVRGWSPVGDDDVEVNVSHDLCLTTLTSITSSSAFLSPLCPPLNLASTLPKVYPSQPHSTPLATSVGVTRAPIAPSSDRRAHRNRNRDPSWIPRPRNAFIIFRCEYSRKHAQGSQELQNDPDPNYVSKTLSKRAAEAWKILPPSEREWYKTLADREREEHARLYPHYRFRPIKRQVSGPRSERSPSPRAQPLQGHPAPSANHLPSVLAAAPDRVKVSTPMPQATAELLPEPSSHPVSQINSEESLNVNCNDPVLPFPSSEASLPSDISPVDLYSSLCASAVSIPLDTFRCDDSAFDLDPTHGDLERTKALEYAMGLYNHDLLPTFSFPEYY